MKNFAFLGATDRMNYGDLLFPLVLKQYIQESDFNEAVVKNYGIVQSDLSDYGAIPTKKISSLFSNEVDQNTVIIIVGGEVLSANWKKIYGYCNPVFSNLMKYRVARKLISDKLVQRFLGSKSTMPFVLTPSNFELPLKIAYNSVGGIRSIKAAKRVANELREANYVSVRDTQCSELLAAVGLENVPVVPDTAILMSKYYPLDYLSMKCSKVVEEYIKSNKEEYIFFQIGLKKSNSEFAVLANQLEAIIVKCGKKVCLCPIGTAPGHEDHIALRQIYKLLHNHHDAVQIMESPNLWEIMSLISNSYAYLGTSLHGVITAMSFDVPYLGLNPSIAKLNAYLEDWGYNKFNKIASENEISEVFLNFYSSIQEKDYSELRKLRGTQIALAEQSLFKIAHI